VLAGFTAGAGFLLRGLRLITRPGLRRFVVVPLFINVVVFSALGLAGAQGFDWLLSQLLPTGDAWWLEVLRGVLWVLFAAAALIILLFTFSVVANLLGSPFNGVLAARVEQLLRGGDAPDSGRGLLGEAAASIAGEVRKFIYFLFLMIVGVVVTIVPVINVVSPLLWALIAMWMLALEYVAYPMENRGIAFHDVRETLRGNRALALGFGAAAMVAMMIPLVNLVVMPAAVAGATAMWVERLAASAGGAKRERAP